MSICACPETAKLTKTQADSRLHLKTDICRGIITIFTLSGCAGTTAGSSVVVVDDGGTGFFTLFKDNLLRGGIGPSLDCRDGLDSTREA